MATDVRGQVLTRMFRRTLAILRKLMTSGLSVPSHLYLICSAFGTARFIAGVEDSRGLFYDLSLIQETL